MIITHSSIRLAGSNSLTYYSNLLSSIYRHENITHDTLFNEVIKMQITKKYRKESIYTYETKNNNSRRRTACD